MKPRFRCTLACLCLAMAATAEAQLRPSPGLTAPAAAAPATPGSAPSNPEFEKAATTAAHAWLTLLDRRDWGTAWDTAGQPFRQTVPLGTWMDAVPKVRTPFGNFLEREASEALYRTTMPGRAAGHYVSVMFVSRFDKQVVQEVVTTVREPDGRWRVIGYSPTPR